MNIDITKVISLQEVTVAFDVDSVLCSCNEKIAQIEGLSHDKSTSWQPDGSDWDVRFEYYSDPDFVKEQPLFPEAKEVISSLRKMGAQVRFVTAVDPNCLAARYNWLVKELDATGEEICLCSDKSKYVSDYYLDDNQDNILKSASKNPVLMRKPWNTTLTSVMSVNNLQDFVYFIVYNEVLKKTSVPVKKNAINVLVGACGSGKAPIASAYCKKTGAKHPEVYSTENNDKYCVVSDDEFFRMRDNGDFAEISTYAGKHYGIPKNAFLPDEEYILSSDIGGAIALKRLYPSRVNIFFVKSNKIDIIRNILQKESICQESKVLLLANLDYELGNKKYCEYVVRNEIEIIDLMK